MVSSDIVFYVCTSLMSYVNVAAYHGVNPRVHHAVYNVHLCASQFIRVFFSCEDSLLITPFLRSFEPMGPRKANRGRPCLKLAKTLLPPLAVPLSSSKKTILTGPGRILTGGAGAGDEKLGAGLWRRCCP